MDLTLPGGAGPVVRAMVEEFPIDYGTALAPVQLGQLKSVAAPFYARLREVGYDTRANLLNQGYPGSWTYPTPWDPNTPVADNLGLANLGQIKMTFSWSLDGFQAAIPDADGDQLPDPWEVDHGLNPASGGDADADADGDGLSNVQEYFTGTNPPLDRYRRRHDRRRPRPRPADLQPDAGDLQLSLRDPEPPGKRPVES